MGTEANFFDVDEVSFAGREKYNPVRTRNNDKRAFIQETVSSSFVIRLRMFHHQLGHIISGRWGKRQVQIEEGTRLK